MSNGLLAVSAFSRQTGFSLLEVLVAFVVMGLVVGGLLQLFGSSMRSTVLADEYSFAIQIAESQLAKVGTEIPVKQGRESGKDKNSAYTWQVSMEPIELAPQEKLAKLPFPLHLYQVLVTVNWQSGTVKRELHLTSLRYGQE